MYTPTYTITQYILNYIIKCELATERIRTTQLPDMYFQELFERLSAEDIDKLGEIVGNEIGYNKALLVQRGKVLPTGKSKDRIFTNYRSVKDFTNMYSSTTFYKPSTELMVHINKLIAKGLVDEWEIGKLRTFSEKPNEIYDSWYKLRDFYPNLSPKRHFDTIFLWLNQQKNTPHKLIQIAVLLFEIMDKAPFTAFNQITGIITTATLLKEYGYNDRNLIPIAKSVNQVSEEIVSAFKISKSKKDLTIFIETVLYTLALSSQDVSTQVKNVYSKKVKSFNKLDDKLNPRQIKMLEIIEREKRITRIAYAKVMGVSFMTAFRDLQELLEFNYLTQKGVGRGTYYTLKKAEKIKDDKKSEKSDSKIRLRFD